MSVTALHTFVATSSLLWGWLWPFGDDKPEAPAHTVGTLYGGAAAEIGDEPVVADLRFVIEQYRLFVELDAGTGARTASDYRSANGVAINGALITRETALADGDEIRLGETTMIYQVEDHPDAKTALAAARRRSEWKRSTLMRPE